MTDIKITLETLYDVLRNEKKREDLQKLDPAFFIDVVHYLREKEALLKSKQESQEVFAIGERDKLEYELRSLRRILKEIYEKREKKIIDIALNRSKTGSNIIDTSAMLYEEKEFYQAALDVLNQFREGIINRLFQGQLPEVPQLKSTVQEKKEQLKKELDTSFQQVSGVTRIRFIRPLPSFVWKDLKEYGPYDTGEEAEFASEVAELIVRKGRAERV